MSSAQFCFFIFRTQSPKAISATFCFAKSFTWYAICHAIVTIFLAFFFFWQYLCLCLCVPFVSKEIYLRLCFKKRRRAMNDVIKHLKLNEIKKHRHEWWWGWKWLGRSFFAIFCWFYPSTSLFFVVVLLHVYISFRDKLALHLVWEKMVILLFVT